MRCRLTFLTRWMWSVIDLSRSVGESVPLGVFLSISVLATKARRMYCTLYRSSIGHWIVVSKRLSRVGFIGEAGVMVRY